MPTDPSPANAEGIDLPGHTPVMAQCQWVTFYGPYDQGFVIQVAHSVPQ
jgi:hypothetical protein